MCSSSPLLSNLQMIPTSNRYHCYCLWFVCYSVETTPRSLYSLALPSHPQNWYCFSKTVAESDAYKYAENNGLDLVTVCPSLVLGPMLQSTINYSSLILIKLLKGEEETSENKLRVFVDVRDVAEALLLAYEKQEARGRYICTSHQIKVRDQVEILRSMYPNYNYPTKYIEVDDEVVLSSEKLQRLGWGYRPLKETLADSVQWYQEAGLLNGD